MKTDMHYGQKLQTGFGKRLPVILQTEMAECGLACLAMVASYYGLKTDLQSLRRRFPISLRGISLPGLIQVAGAMQLLTRPVKLDLPDMGQLKLPCILHWDMNHFVVLRSVAKDHVMIHDPAVGERRISMAEVGKHFTGVALELGPTPSFVPHDEGRRLGLLQLMGNVHGLGSSLTHVLLLALALEVVAILAPFYLQWVVDQAVVSGDRDLITLLGLGFGLLVIIQTAITAARAWVLMVLSVNLNFQWLGNVFAHMLHLPMVFFERRHLGDIVSRFRSIDVIQQALTSGFVEVLVDGLLTLGTLAMMFLYSSLLASISLMAVLLYGLMKWAIYKPLRQATAEEIIHAARQQTHFLETVRGMQGVRLFGRADVRRIGWMNMLAEQFNAGLRVRRINIGTQTINVLLFGLERVAVIWLAALAVLDHSFTVGMLFAFVSYKDQFSTRFAGLIDKLLEMRMLGVHGDRLADIVLAERESEDSISEINLSHIKASIELQHIGFRYSQTEAAVIDDISLSIAEGEFVAIVGPSGCGKTTLAKIVLGLLPATQGQVLVGGVALQKLGLENYRRMVGTVMQEDSLFTGSIAENISFFDVHPDPQQVEACARLAAIHDEITAMPMGYNTLVGDIGTGMSGGQKQRVLLARALYRRPRILVLDEATSHLDVTNERAVNHAVKELKLTRIIIAHRPETIAMAERVIRLERGHIVV